MSRCWYSVPAALVQLSSAGRSRARDLRDAPLGALRRRNVPGRRHLRRLREQLPTARFSHVYGSTEVNVCTCYHLPERPLARRAAAHRPAVLDV